MERKCCSCFISACSLPLIDSCYSCFIDFGYSDFPVSLTYLLLIRDDQTFLIAAIRVLLILTVRGLLILVIRI
jgi:hypothetical protein